MNVLAFPPVPSNDNDEPIVWTCTACDNIAFVLHHEFGVTSIKCGQCGEDVTDAVSLSLPVGINLCQT